ncbi:hypothetical protein B0H14DRAFT_3444086 [Mycena olivaceomarginata]|nr:hypothetical protein B0H14DRAFT_3444086 [Mycena olivaceomarginata]
MASLSQLPALRVVYISCNTKLATPLAPGTRRITREHRHSWGHGTYDLSIESYVHPHAVAVGSIALHDVLDQSGETSFLCPTESFLSWPPCCPSLILSHMYNPLLHLNVVGQFFAQTVQLFHTFRHSLPAQCRVRTCHVVGPKAQPTRFRNRVDGKFVRDRWRDGGVLLLTHGDTVSVSEGVGDSARAGSVVVAGVIVVTGHLVIPHCSTPPRVTRQWPLHIGLLWFLNVRACSSYIGSPSFGSLPSFGSPPPPQPPTTRLSRITERTEESRPSSIARRPLPSLHSHASTEPGLPPPGCATELIAVFESGQHPDFDTCSVPVSPV